MNPPTSRTQRPSAARGRPGRPRVGAQTRQTGRRVDVGRRGTAPGRVGVAGGWIQRRQPQKKQSGLGKALGGLSGALSGLGKGRAKPAASSGKAKRGGQVGGVALLTAAAGLALKNRGKLTAMLRRDEQAGPEAGVAGAPAAAPVTDSAGPAPARNPALGGDGATS
jgi:hypothetical protein